MFFFVSFEVFTYIQIQHVTYTSQYFLTDLGNFFYQYIESFCSFLRIMKSKFQFNFINLESDFHLSLSKGHLYMCLSMWMCVHSKKIWMYQFRVSKKQMPGQN